MLLWFAAATLFVSGGIATSCYTFRGPLPEGIGVLGFVFWPLLCVFMWGAAMVIMVIGLWHSPSVLTGCLFEKIMDNDDNLLDLATSVLCLVGLVAVVIHGVVIHGTN